MARVVCTEYTSGIFNDVAFREEVVDGSVVGVAEVEGALLDWFRARAAFVVTEPEPEKPKAEKPKK